MRFRRPSEAQFRAQLDIIEQYADLRIDRAEEITTQLASPVPYMATICYLNPDRTPWTLELLDLALRLAYCVEQRAKYALACKRPNEYSAQIQPMIPTPLHGALPSGHSTEAHIVATVMTRLLHASGVPNYQGAMWPTQFFRLAARIAINRTVAGVHFPADSAAGACLGMTLGQYLVARASHETSYDAWYFNGPAFSGDFDWAAMFDPATRQQQALAGGATSINAAGQPLGANGRSPVLKYIWDKAVEEWQV